MEDDLLGHCRLGKWCEDQSYSEEKSLCHVAMVAKFLDLNNMSCNCGSRVDQCTCIFLHWWAKINSSGREPPILSMLNHLNIIIPIVLWGDLFMGKTRQTIAIVPTSLYPVGWH